MTLEGGIKGWAKAGPQYTQLIDGYKPDYWSEVFAEEEAKSADNAAQPSNSQPAAAR